MPNKTKNQLEEQIRVDCRLKEERELSDKFYAEKRVQIVVYTFVGMALIALIGAVFNLVILKWKKS